MDAASTVRAYYDALREGDPLYPFFADESTTVKVGIGERLTGYEAVRAGLAEQTRTTDDWTAESERLVVSGTDGHAWFSDDVLMAWTDTERDYRHEYDTRWSGALQHRGDAADLGTPWRFVGMHVSTEGATGG